MSTLFPKKIEYEYHTNGTAGSYDDATGDWIPGTTGTSFFMGSVQPASGKEVDSLEVGRQDTGKVKVYSGTVLPVSKEGGDEAGAIVYWKGQKWELIYDATLQNGLIPHYKYIGQYVGEITE